MRALERIKRLGENQTLMIAACLLAAFTIAMIFATHPSTRFW